jgi:hypothetical protein
MINWTGQQWTAVPLTLPRPPELLSGKLRVRSVTKDTVDFLVTWEGSSCNLINGEKFPNLFYGEILPNT